MPDRVSITVDIDDVLEEIPADNIVKHFRSCGALDDLLEAIGKEDCKEYFNLTEEEAE